MGASAKPFVLSLLIAMGMANPQEPPGANPRRFPSLGVECAPRERRLKVLNRAERHVTNPWLPWALPLLGIGIPYNPIWTQNNPNTVHKKVERSGQSTRRPP